MIKGDNSFCVHPFQQSNFFFFFKYQKFTIFVGILIDFLFDFLLQLHGNLPANPVNDRRITNAVTKDGSTVRYVQNLRTTYLEPYRTNVPYPYHYKKSVPYQRTFLGPHFGGVPGGVAPKKFQETQQHKIFLFLPT